MTPLFPLKGERKLVLLRANKPIKAYRISLGRHPIGHKEQAGDAKTPEGLYTIDYRLIRSVAHRALRISYPNAADRQRAVARQVDPGGQIMIHGMLNGLGFLGRWHRWHDWTAGCIAVTDAEIEEILGAVKDGTPIEIRA